MLHEHLAEVRLDTTAADLGDEDKPALALQQVEFARDVRAGHDIEDDIHTGALREVLGHGVKIPAPRVDRPNSAELLAGPALLRRAGRCENARAERLGKLNGRNA